jgi:hypothetical protein
MVRLRVLFGVVFVSLLIAGCGGDSDDEDGGGPDRSPAASTTEQQTSGEQGSSGEQESGDEAASVWLETLKATISGDGEAACPNYTGESRRSLIEQARASSCEEAVEKVAELFGEDERAAIEDIEIDDVSIEGDQATVRYTAPEILEPVGADGEAHLRRTGGRWFVQSDDEVEGDS